jgi:hypothetical protein
LILNLSRPIVYELERGTPCGFLATECIAARHSELHGGRENQSCNARDSQPRNENVALEALIEPELLIAAGEFIQMLRYIGG